MLMIGRDKIDRRNLGSQLQMITGDAEVIPFDDESFDAVTISFGIRNVVNIKRALEEMRRVLKPGGRALILEFSLPGNTLVRSCFLFYFRKILPSLGGVIAGDKDAYRYLNKTVETFPYGNQFCDLLKESGFVETRLQPLTLGIASIYQGDKK
jgi:demethylmenaquinone methyltransferase/2-methoxy-6-polyprenyl-1,4-benzoquinol methylase